MKKAFWIVLAGFGVGYYLINKKRNTESGREIYHPNKRMFNGDIKVTYPLRSDIYAHTADWQSLEASTLRRADSEDVQRYILNQLKN